MIPRSWREEQNRLTLQISNNARAILTSVAQQKGLTFSEEVKTTILHQLDNALRYEGGKVYLLDQNGNRAVTATSAGKVIDQPVDEYVLGLARPFLEPVDVLEETGKAPPAADGKRPANLTAHMRKVLAERRQKAAQVANTIAGNPWSPERANLTHQMAISKADPARAAKLKKDAGVVE